MMLNYAILMRRLTLNHVISTFKKEEEKKKRIIAESCDAVLRLTLNHAILIKGLSPKVVIP